jgi:murein DD-endopeptidase MepM/ murein hydrolase activator NlpD
MRKRYYVFFVARDEEGELRKIHIPMHYLYVFLAGALLGMFVITGMAGSYTRMLMKVAHFNQLRSEKEALKQRASTLEKVAKEKEIEAATLSSLAGEVSQLYGLKNDPPTPASNNEDSDAIFNSSIHRLNRLRNSAMNGTAMNLFGLSPGETYSDWLHLASSPSLWPVEGHVTGSFGERIDPFNGEGAFHNGLDISTGYGQPVHAPADGRVSFAEIMNGYGRVVILEHSHGISTRFGHLSGFAVSEGQFVHRGEVIGFVGRSGRSTGPHLHYEVRINDTPVNPHRYLRATAHTSATEGSD